MTGQGKTTHTAGLDRLEGKGKTLFLIPLIVGAIALAIAVGMAFGSPEASKRFFFAYIANFAWVLSITLGGLFFVLIQYLTRAGWSVTVRRIAETIAMNMPLVALLFLPIAFTVFSGKGDVYPWAKNVEWKDVLKEHLAEEKREAAEVKAEAEGHGEAKVEAKIETKVEGKEEAKAEAPKTENGLPAPAPIPDAPAGKVVSGAERGFGNLSPFMAKKEPWLNIKFFLARWIIYFAGWSIIAWVFGLASLKQDKTGEPLITNRLQSLSPISAMFFAVTLTFGAWDMIMSLNPIWYSTIFGVYYFAGAMGNIFSVLILSMYILQANGYLTNRFTKEHYHDLGKFLFGFTIFYAYIAFSQFMLIWYANIPEETFWFRLRGASTHPTDFNGWSYVSISLIICRFLIPFLGLMSRHVKRNPTTLAFWAVWILVFQWVDYWWQVEPELSSSLLFGLPEILTFIGIAGIASAGVLYRLSKVSLLPINDPRLPEALAHVNN